MNLRKLVITFILLTYMLLTGCTGEREIDKLAIATSIGIDKSEDGYLVTVQVINPKTIALQKTIAESPIILYTETGRDLFKIMRRITKQSPRKIYNSHLRTIIFSEDIAKEGIQKTLDFFIRDHEFRTDFYFLIARGTTANNALSVITPLELLPGINIYDSLENSEKSWAPTKTIQIYDLVNDLISKGKNPVLTGVGVRDSTNPSNSIDVLKQSDSSRLILSDLGAFQNDKLVGWLNEEESKGFNYIIGNVKDTVAFIDYNDQNQITYEVIQAKARSKAYILNNRPAIHAEIMLKANISAQTGDLDIENEEINKKIAGKIEEKLKSYCNAVLERTKNDLKTDIFGFGEVIHRTYPELWKEFEDKWDQEFSNIPVNIQFRVKITNLGQNTKSIFSKGSE